MHHKKNEWFFFQSNTYIVLFVNKVNLITQTKIQSFKDVTKKFSNCWKNTYKILLLAPKFKNWFVGSIRLCLLWHHVSSAFFSFVLRSSYWNHFQLAAVQIPQKKMHCNVPSWLQFFYMPRLLDYYFPFASSEFISFAFHCTKMTPHKALNSQSWTKNHLNWFQKSLLMIPTFSTRMHLDGYSCQIY